MSVWYCASRSISTARQPSMRAAWPVVPVPANGSMMVAPGGAIIRMKYRSGEIGLTVGCFDPARSPLVAFEP